MKELKIFSEETKIFYPNHLAEVASAHVGWRGHPELVLLDLLVPAVHRVAPAQLLDVRRAAGPIRGEH